MPLSRRIDNKTAISTLALLGPRPDPFGSAPHAPGESFTTTRRRIPGGDWQMALVDAVFSVLLTPGLQFAAGGAPGEPELIESLLERPGPDALVTVYTLGGEKALAVLAAERYGEMLAWRDR